MIDLMNVNRSVQLYMSTLCSISVPCLMVDSAPFWSLFLSFITIFIFLYIVLMFSTITSSRIPSFKKEKNILSTFVLPLHSRWILCCNFSIFVVITIKFHMYVAAWKLLTLFPCTQFVKNCYFIRSWIVPLSCVKWHFFFFVVSSSST